MAGQGESSGIIPLRSATAPASYRRASRRAYLPAWLAVRLGPAMSERGGFGPLVRYPGFVRLWLADGLSNFGTFVSVLAIQLVMINKLAATPLEIGLVRSAQWLPSLLLGLIAGVIADRVHRKRLLMGADLVSALLLFAIAGLALADSLSMTVLTIIAFLLGAAAVLQGGAHQSFTADLLPPRLLTAGNVALSQTYTTAQTVGPLVAGVLIRLVGAPLAIFIDGLSYAASALLLWRVPNVDQERSPASASIWSDLKEGVAWVYRHPSLAPYALTLHVWFIGSAIAGTIYVFHATSLGLDSVAIGATLACAGVAGVLGSAIAERLSQRFGLGPVAAVADVLAGTAWAIIGLVATGTHALATLCVAQFIFGLALGIRGPIEMSYRNAITPSRLRGRMNTTIRSFNWGLIAVAAPVGGWLAVTFGDRVALLVAAGIMAGSGAALLLTPFRTARMPTSS